MTAKGTILLDGIAVSGVNVFVSTPQGEPIRNPNGPGFIGTTTNALGQFELANVLMNQHISASFVGYKTVTVPVSSLTSFASTVTLPEAQNTLREFEVVGKKRSIVAPLSLVAVGFLVIFMYKKYF
jgi:hypothetical protein